MKNIRAGLALPFSKMADGRQNSCSADDRSRREMSARGGKLIHRFIYFFHPSLVGVIHLYTSRSIPLRLCSTLSVCLSVRLSTISSVLPSLFLSVSSHFRFSSVSLLPTSSFPLVLFVLSFIYLCVYVCL